MKQEFIGLLTEGINFPDTHRTEFVHQLCDARNFGAEIVDCELISPLC
jgi:hypothetical protein